jgi:uncharacterized membrane protein
VEHSVVIGRPIEEVFAFAADPNNNPLWHSFTLETQTVSGVEVEVGTAFDNVIKFLGRRIETTLEIVENEPPRRQRVRVTSGPIPASGCYDFEPADGGGSTRFTYTLDAEVGGFFKLAEPLVGRAARRQTETDMATLKDLLEAGAPEGM